jgi:hypothetical protein
VRRIALIALAFGGCFTPSFDDAKTPCTANSDCPPGFHCASDNTCWHEGRDPVDMAVPLEADLATSDAASADLLGLDLLGVIKHKGEACSPTDTCDTGQCVDGYCCDSACTTACKACNVTGLLGICSNVAVGTSPVGTRTCNGQPSSSCGLDGKCDGNGNCRDWVSGTVCAPGTCTNGNFVNPSTCNGTGNCVAGSGGSCAPYVCKDSTQCYSSCSDSSQCSGSNTCTNMSCGKLSNGQPCAGGNGALCASGNCVDGYCCDSACTMPCQACDAAGKQGTCSTVPAGLPHGTRMCTNQGTAPCGGTCDGTVATCTYAGNTVTCGSTCTSSTQQQVSYCNAAGSCAASSPTTCANHLACVGSACLTMCSSNNDCAPLYGCTPSQTCLKICVYDQDNYDNGSIYAP